MFISLKMAIRQVIRRPRQNIAVVLGIALGVSLFVGVQVGSDSLTAGLVELSNASLGETDAQIIPTISPFFVTQDILQEEMGGSEAPSVLSQLNSGGHMMYIKGITERLELQITAVVPETGSTEVSRTLVGIPTDETGFGTFSDDEGNELSITDLQTDEIYIGRSLADLLFLDIDPVGRDLTLKATFQSLAFPGMDLNTTLVDLQLSVSIAGVFEDEGRGEELYSNFAATPLDWLQNVLTDRINTINSQTNTTIYGYGSSPISRILINWNDDIETGVESQTATDALEVSFHEVIGPLADFYIVQDTRNEINSAAEAGVESLELLLNVFGAVIILAGVLVIINIQNMALAAREKETGILRAIGAERGQIIRANLYESMFLGVFGSLVGLVGGYLYGGLLVFFLGYAFGFDSSNIPTVVTSTTLISSFIAGFVISQLTGLYPAIRASRINVAQVLRGIDPPPEESFGRKSLYLGVILTILAVLMVFNLDPNPLFDGRDAFVNLQNTENNYLPIAFLVLGPALLVAYYRSKVVGLTVVGGGLLAWAYFNIFVVFDWIEQGSGGTGYVLFIILSLLIGTIIFVAINLGTIAQLGQNLFSWLARKRKTPIRGTTLIAFKKMRSNVTRSTLTFSLFAVILTLNIFIGTWSYSFRFGFDSQILEVAGGADIMLYSSDNPIPTSIGITDELLNDFGDTSRDVHLTDVKSFTVISGQSSYLDSEDLDTERSIRTVAMSNNSLWEDENQENWIFTWDLVDNKTGTPYETYEDQPDDPAATEEDEVVWQDLVANATIPNENGEDKPIIITSPIGDFGPTGNFEQKLFTGDSIWLNLTEGGTQEFVLAAIATGNPIMDYGTPTDGPPVFNPVIFVGDMWKDKLLAFNGFQNYVTTLLGRTNVEDINSDELPPMLTEIEKWANEEDGEFRTEHGLYGIVGITVYSIYETVLESNYRFFGFLQAFTSLGFVVGILGLLVVASRSVAERTREIGMLRALGFRQGDIVISVVLELVVMGLLGLIIGLFNGIVMGYALTDINSGGDASFLIPWLLLGLYTAVTLISATIAAIFPAINASRIPASDALRYTG